MPFSTSRVLRLRFIAWATIALTVAFTAPLHAAAPSWLVSRVFGGVGGFGLYGIDAEADLRPNAGDPYIWTDFDRETPAQWEVRKPNVQGAILVEDHLLDYSWSRGTGYAHLYYRSEGGNSVFLHLVHNGIASSAWCDGIPVQLSDDAHPPQTALNAGTSSLVASSLTDQGNVLQVVTGKLQGPRLAVLPAGPDWHRLLLKLTNQEPKDGSMVFSAAFTDAQGQALSGFQTSVDDPEVDAKLHACAAPLTPLAKTDAPFNLVHPGLPLKLMVTLAPIAPRIVKGTPPPPTPLPPKFFSAVLHVRVTDYDGKETGSFESAATFPGTVVLDLGAAPATGYYGLHLSLSTSEGKPIISYPPDGFSVVRGTAAQGMRKAVKKMAVTYYFMGGQDLYKTLFFPYMHRIGIFRNVGGMNGRNLPFYQAAHEQGLFMSPDFWTHDDPAYVDAYVHETAPLVDSYKSFNEIDIAPAIRKTPEYWVNREKQEYPIVKKYAPNATVLGGSLVRVGNDSWFTECLKLGLDQYQDAWDVHAYPKDAPKLEGTIANAPTETDLGVEMCYEKLGRKNDKPFWLGESGARCSHGDDARRWQAEMVTKMIAWALSRPDFKVIGFLVPWDYSREKGSLGDIEAGHMPAEAAYYTASALIDGFSYHRLDLGKNIQAAQFGDTVLIWSTGGPQSVQIPLPVTGPWVQVDVVGRISPLEEGENHRAALTATKSPVYLLSRATYDQLTAFTPEEAAQP